MESQHFCRPLYKYLFSSSYYNFIKPLVDSCCKLALCRDMRSIHTHLGSISFLCHPLLLAEDDMNGKKGGKTLGGQKAEKAKSHY